MREKLLVGDRLGELPEGLPALPLQQDIDASIRRLRLKTTASVTQIELDLRENGGRARSVFLHRLVALEIPWGESQEARSKGTFKESWRLQWKPELAVAIIDASAFGNTVEAAAIHRLTKKSADDERIATITARLDLALLGDLPDAVGALLRFLDAAAATSNDVSELLDAAPSLARISRYGDVRATDSAAVGHLLTGFAARIHAGLLSATSGLSDEAADHLTKSLAAYASALAILDDDILAEDFRKVLGRMISAETVHPRIRGQAVRLLRDVSHLDDETVARHFGFALSSGMPALSAAAWLEGFLQGGGSLLVHDVALLDLVDAWISSLGDENFQATLPLLRRTFGTFSMPERVRIAGSISQEKGKKSTQTTETNFNKTRALPALAAVAKLLGLPQV